MTNQPNQTRSNEEAQAITMMKEVRRQANCASDIMVANVFTMMWTSSISAAKVVAITATVYDWYNVNDGIQASLTRLTRKKVLRSRMVSGKRLYEINY